MANLERQKYKKLGVNFLLIIVFIVQMLIVTGVSFSQSFIASSYPLAYIIDTFLFISLLINPILISSLIRKIVKLNATQIKIKTHNKINSCKM